MADIIEQPLQQSNTMSLTSALTELSLASLTLTQHNQESTTQPIVSESTTMDDKQSAADGETKPVLETHTAPPAVVFMCTPCHLHFKTEKQLQNHIRYAKAHNISSSSATADDPIAYDSFDMQPGLHDEVSRLLETYNLSFRFVERDGSQGITKQKATSIRAPQTWTSGKVAITIRRYSRSEYNARVYYQRCKSCDTACRPELDNTYAERVSYRLAVWSGIRMPALPHGPTAPHDARLCEGCRAGHRDHIHSFDPNLSVITRSQMNRIAGRRQQQAD
ncbi:hypothetical protein LTR56_015949 [Elasticomyces elasticus]|nr:hypothetical protein LTR56_015949 [Elasticomyces elasticus]KAK3655294.1 hypothetical protein LTR22_010324 [Elasticomyces elasticus]KAK4918650.1 hypothetical protein LTR49_013575 [Elasticomyces elasticus]